MVEKDAPNDVLLNAIFRDKHRPLTCSHSCDCSCHGSGGRTVHIMACCVRCDLCGGNIKEQMMKIHKTDCHKIGLKMETL